MGEASHLENIQEKGDDAQFCDHEIAPDLKALLVAPVEPRNFPRGSGLAVKLKLRVKKPKRRSKSSGVRSAFRPKLGKVSAGDRRAIATARSYNSMLHSLADRQASYLAAHAIYERNQKIPRRRSLDVIRGENGRLRVIVQEQAKLLKRRLGRLAPSIDG